MLSMLVLLVVLYDSSEGELSKFDPADHHCVPQAHATDEDPTTKRRAGSKSELAAKHKESTHMPMSWHSLSQEIPNHRLLF